MVNSICKNIKAHRVTPKDYCALLSSRKALRMLLFCYLEHKKMCTQGWIFKINLFHCFFTEASSYFSNCNCKEQKNVMTYPLDCSGIFFGGGVSLTQWDGVIMKIIHFDYHLKKSFMNTYRPSFKKTLI